MRTIKYYILFLICSLSAFAYSDNKELLNELDRLIDLREEFESQKRDKLGFLKQLAASEHSPDKKYDLIYRIIEEYESFQSDSAFVYIEEGRQLALQNRNDNQWLANRFQYVFVCAQSGLLNESQSVLESLRFFYPKMSDAEKAVYYILYERLFMNLREYSQNSHLELLYARQEQAYNDSILVYLDQSNPLYDYHTFKKMYMEERFREALPPIEQYLKQINTLSNDGARGYYQLSLLHRKYRDKISEEQALIWSVMADEQSVVRQNRSLRLLAQLLYEQGDIRRAYRYIQISLDDANFYNTKLRGAQVAEALPIIEKDYLFERDRDQKRLRIGFVLISILFVILFLSVLYVRKKRLQLSFARKELLRHNEELGKINEEIQQKNKDLNCLASDLRESDQIKEKYVGHFLRLCSVYIQKMDDYRKMVNRKVKTGQIEDLYKITSSNQSLQNESKDFYQQFDEAFLDIFPNFVDDFNRLLKEDQQFVLKKGELLNTELRIFALIRLGIKDSSEIADCLGYTAVTIYSYRTKVKSKAIDKDSFHADLMAIKRKVG